MRVALSREHAPLYIFPHYLIKGTILKEVIEHKMRVLVCSTTFCVKHFSFQEELNGI